MRKALPLVLILAAAGIAALWWRAESGLADARRRVAELEASLAKAQAGAVTPSGPQEADDAEKKAPATEPKIVRIPSGTDPSEYLKTIDELRQRTSDLTRELSEAKEEAARAEAQRSASIAELEKLQNQQTVLRDDLQSARRAITAMEAELSTKSSRLASLEASEGQTKAKLAVVEAAASKAAQASKEIEEINRQRENYINSLLRRYREVTDLYRNFALNVQNRENQTAGMQAGDLSRIQSSIQQAEDDLRQLQTLNARAAQLTRGR